MSSVSQEHVIIPKIKYNAIMNVLTKGFHVDRRPLTKFRDIEVKFDIAPNADASALLKLANTQVLAGAKLEISQPFPDNPNEGILIVNAEYLPAASPTFEPGPPDENAIELARVIDRSLREAKVVPLDKLVIIPGRKVWTIWLDIYVLDYDGNLIDACMMASMAVLARMYLPYYEVDSATGNVKVDKSRRQEKLPINRFVATVTVNKIGNLLVIDPIGEEEALADARLAISVSEEGNIVGMQKMGPGYFTEEEIDRAIDLALNVGKEIIAKIKEISSK